MRKLQKKYLGHIPYWHHDLDKILMYIFLPWLGKKRISKIHRHFQPHHILPNKNPNKIRWEEAVLDWESARYTKSDKPLNARQTMEKYYPQYRYWIEPILKKFDL